MQAFSIKECVSFGWKTFRSRPWIFVQAGILVFLVNMLSSFAQSLIDFAGHSAPHSFSLAGLVSVLFGLAVSILISMGQISFFLRAHDAVMDVDLKDLWAPSAFWNFVGAMILVALSVLVGLVLLIVPGIIIGLALSLVIYLVIDQELKPVEAYKKSLAITKGNRLNLFLLSLAILGINLLGLLALVVGLIVSIPVSLLAMVHAYRTLSGSMKSAVALPAEPVLT